MKLYVGNIPHATTQDELKTAFGPYGEVVSASIITDKFTGKSRGFAFVEFASEAEGQAAIDALNGSDLGGRTIKVNKAMAREEKPRGGGGFGGGRGGGDRDRGPRRSSW